MQVRFNRLYNVTYIRELECSLPKYFPFDTNDGVKCWCKFSYQPNLTNPCNGIDHDTVPPDSPRRAGAGLLQ